MPTIKKKAYAGKKQTETEIVTLAQKVSKFISADKKIFTITLSVLAAILLSAGGYLLKLSMDEQSAGPLFAAAYELYKPAGGSNADYARALDLFRTIHKKYPSSVSGKISGYYAGNCLMNLGKNEEALKEYQAFIKDYGNDKFILGLVYERLGYLYSELGNQAEAIKAFEKSDALSGPGIATVELARLYDSAKNAAESQKKYKIIADKLAGTRWATEAMGKVQKIEPPAMPAPAKSK